MFKPAYTLIWILALALTACGGEDAAHIDLDASGGASKASGSSPKFALETLTADKLDAYIETLRAGKADPDRDAFDIARARGWKSGDWTFLHAAVKGVTVDGGFDAMLARLQRRIEGANAQIAELERNLAGAAAAQKPMIEKAVETLRKATVGWQRTLDRSDALRAGAELVEGRMADIKATRVR